MERKGRPVASRKGSQRKEPPTARLDKLIEEVTPERIDMTDDEQIVAVCARGQSRQRVPILDLSLPSSPPESAEWIDAYRRWARER